MAALEKIGFVEVRKQFIGKKPNTTYAITVQGRAAFLEHLTSLEKLIKQIQS
jgi:DNA-binding PadR family transcriptional regulator